MSSSKYRGQLSYRLAKGRKWLSNWLKQSSPSLNLMECHLRMKSSDLKNRMANDSARPGQFEIGSSRGLMGWWFRHALAGLKWCRFYFCEGPMDVIRLFGMKTCFLLLSQCSLALRIWFSSRTTFHATQLGQSRFEWLTTRSHSCHCLITRPEALECDQKKDGHILKKLS